MKELLNALKESPRLPQLVEELNAFWEAEQAKRQEFYNLVHENVKAEFIGGEIIFHSPVRSKHWIACTRLSARLTIHVDENKLGLVGVEKVMIRCTRNNYEPDIVFFDREQTAAFAPDQLVFPPPKLAIEVLSGSTRDNDYGVKFQDYAAHDVEEYWIIDADQKSVEQYVLEEKNYQLHQKLSEQGEIRSKVIEGFSVDIRVIFE
ncbi:MAG: Uma2 family endonuclease [Bacteroidota bacterium]